MQVFGYLLGFAQNCICFYNFVLQLLYRTNALFLGAILAAPDGQRDAPVAGAGKVPVLEVFQPFAKAAFTGCGGFPVDGLVQFKHALLHGRRLDKPTIEWIVQHGAVSAPAVWIRVDVFFGTEKFVFFLQLDHDVDVYRPFFYLTVVFDVAASKIGHFGHEAAPFVYQRHGVACLIFDHQRYNAVLFGHPEVVGTKSRCNVYDARTIFGADKIAQKRLEGWPVGLHVRQQLLVFDPFQFAAFHFGYDLDVGDGLVAWLDVFGFEVRVLLRKVLAEAVFGQNHNHGCARVAVETAHFDVGDVFTQGYRRIGRQRPGRGGPGQEVLVVAVHNFEHGDRRCIADFAVSVGLVQFMRTQSCARCRGVRLDGIAFVQQVFVVQLLQQPPHRLDVVVFVSDVRIVEVDPVADFAGDVVPAVFVHHHRFAALAVVIVYRDGFTDVFLGDAQFFLHTQFDWQTVGIPAAFALYALAFHGVVTAKNIFNGPRHHVVDAGHPVGGRRSFVKYVAVFYIALFDAFFKNVLFFPKC